MNGEEGRRDYPLIQEELISLKVGMGRIEERQIAIDKRINGNMDRVEIHIREGDSPGGYRDRLAKLEATVLIAASEKLNSVKASQWRIGIIAGIPGIILAICKIVDLVIKYHY